MQAHVAPDSSRTLIPVEVHIGHPFAVPLFALIFALVALLATWAVFSRTGILR